MFPGAFANVRLFALDPYDLALSKLQRNSDRDMEDVKRRAMTVPFEVTVLEQRYQLDQRPYLTGRVEREDLTLRLWIQMIKEQQQSQ